MQQEFGQLKTTSRRLLRNREENMQPLDKGLEGTSNRLSAARRTITEQFQREKASLVVAAAKFRNTEQKFRSTEQNASKLTGNKT